MARPRLAWSGGDDGQRSHEEDSMAAMTPGVDGERADPWTDLNEAGDGLTVDNFLTTVMSQVVSAMRRSATLPYAQQFGLTVPEWRILSLLAHAKSLPFAELVIQSTSDKAPVSR